MTSSERVYVSGTTNSQLLSQSHLTGSVQEPSGFGTGIGSATIHSVNAGLSLSTQQEKETLVSSEMFSETYASDNRIGETLSSRTSDNILKTEQTHQIASKHTQDTPADERNLLSTESQTRVSVVSVTDSDVVTNQPTMASLIGQQRSSNTEKTRTMTSIVDRTFTKDANIGLIKAISSITVSDTEEHSATMRAISTSVSKSTEVQQYTMLYTQMISNTPASEINIHETMRHKPNPTSQSQTSMLEQTPSYESEFVSTEDRTTAVVPSIQVEIATSQHQTSQTADTTDSGTSASIK
ncbi:uncharacterized protein [Ptychodera flava]|uniref:uncharacterized protein n=1 Tax=Ptychodera flava TaxID=63121 RepID=UPI00396A9FA6